MGRMHTSFNFQELSMYRQTPASTHGANAAAKKATNAAAAGAHHPDALATASSRPPASTGAQKAKFDVDGSIPTPWARGAG